MQPSFLLFSNFVVGIVATNRAVLLVVLAWVKLSEDRELDDDDDELLLEFDECRLLSLVAGAWSSLISLSKITHGNP